MQGREPLRQLRRVSPAFFVVNEDGNMPAKAQLCERLGIEYVVLRRDPREQTPRPFHNQFEEGMSNTLPPRPCRRL